MPPRYWPRESSLSKRSRPPWRVRTRTTSAGSSVSISAAVRCSTGWRQVQILHLEVHRFHVATATRFLSFLHGFDAGHARIADASTVQVSSLPRRLQCEGASFDVEQTSTGATNGPSDFRPRLAV